MATATPMLRLVSRKLAISIRDWSDRFNPCLHLLSNPRMLKLMQLQGVNYKGAFALEAAVEDPHRFSKASKLAAYGGFSPIVDSSGDEEENAKRRGGLHKPLDGEGRQDVKFFFTEAGTKTEEATSC